MKYFMSMMVMAWITVMQWSVINNKKSIVFQGQRYVLFEWTGMDHRSDQGLDRRKNSFKEKNQKISNHLWVSNK